MHKERDTQSKCDHIYVPGLQYYMWIFWLAGWADVYTVVFIIRGL